MRKILAFLFCLYLPSAIAKASDHDEHHGSSADEYRVLQEITHYNHKVLLIVREDGHLLGQPFQVELRANCESTSSNPMDWPVQDSFSVCDLSPESVVVNSQKTGVALKTKLADHANFDKQLEMGLQSPQATCEKKTTIKKFSLRGLCK